ncbi:MAG: aldo/keto reductase [Elainellaceae cyanobacterium]
MSFHIMSENPLVVGCWQLDDRSWKAHSEESIARAIDIYMAMGVSTFDTADIYGRSEQVLGRSLKGRTSQVLTKAAFFEEIPTDRQIRHKVEIALRHLKRDKLDGLQLHWHNPQLDLSSTLETFAALVAEGKIAQFGVTNFSLPLLKQAIAHAPITFHQVQYNLIDRRVENGMQEFCLSHDIALLAYGPLAGGFLSDRFRGIAQPKPEPDHARSFHYNNMIKAHGSWTDVQTLLQPLAEVAQRHDKSIAQVALNWVAGQPGVGGVTAGLTLVREQIQQNATALDWEMGASDRNLLSETSASLFTQPGDIYSYEQR